MQDPTLSLHIVLSGMEEGEGEKLNFYGFEGEDEIIMIDFNFDINAE